MRSSWSRRAMNSLERSWPFLGGAVTGATGCWGLTTVISSNAPTEAGSRSPTSGRRRTGRRRATRTAIRRFRARPRPRGRRPSCPAARSRGIRGWGGPPRSPVQNFDLPVVILRVDLHRDLLRHLPLAATDLELRPAVLAVPNGVRAAQAHHHAHLADVRRDLVLHLTLDLVLLTSSQTHQVPHDHPLDRVDLQPALGAPLGRRPQVVPARRAVRRGDVRPLAGVLAFPGPPPVQ